MSEGGNNSTLPQATHWPPVCGPGEGCVGSDHLIHGNVANGEYELTHMIILLGLFLCTNN